MSAKRLPIVTIGDTKWFVDDRLREARNVKNPHERVDEGEFLVLLQSAKVSGIPGSIVHKRYFSWQTHHAPDCLHKRLRTTYNCAVEGCDYRGEDRQWRKQKEKVSA